MCYSAMVKQDLRSLEKRLGAHVVRESFAEYDSLTHKYPERYRPLQDNPRIYPGYHAPIVVAEGTRRVIKPMRYRLRPSWSDREIPTRFNVFNARLDSLETRKSWHPLFMRCHGLVAVERFFESVPDEAKGNGATKGVSFQPEDGATMWVPVLWDRWTDGDEVIESFAIITKEAPAEVLAKGHDRVPIFLREDMIDFWLRPEFTTKEQMYRALATEEQVVYSCTPDLQPRTRPSKKAKPVLMLAPFELAGFLPLLEESQTG